MVKEIERLEEIEKVSKQLLKKIPEWMIFPNWDTKRCIVCKGWLKENGHTDRCVRLKLEKLLFGGGDEN